MSFHYHYALVTTRVLSYKQLALLHSHNLVARFRCGPLSVLFYCSHPSHTHSPPMEIIYDFTATGGTSIVANCVEFVDDNTTHQGVDVTCPLSFVLYGKESTIPSFVLIITVTYACRASTSPKSAHRIWLDCFHRLLAGFFSYRCKSCPSEVARWFAHRNVNRTICTCLWLCDFIVCFL